MVRDDVRGSSSRKSEARGACLAASRNDHGHFAAFVGGGDARGGATVHGDLKKTRAAQHRERFALRALHVARAQLCHLGLAYGDLEGVRRSIKELGDILW